MTFGAFTIKNVAGERVVIFNKDLRDLLKQYFDICEDCKAKGFSPADEWWERRESAWCAIPLICNHRFCIEQRGYV